MFYDLETTREDRQVMLEEAFAEFATMKGQIYASEFALAAEGILSIAITYKKFFKTKVFMYEHQWNDDATTEYNIYNSVLYAVTALEEKGL